MKTNEKRMKKQMNYEKRDKAVTDNQEPECFFIEHGNDYVCFPEFGSLHREADQKFPCMILFLVRKTTIQFALLPMIRLYKPGQYIQSHSFSFLFPTRENQEKRWSKLSWYTYDSCSRWRILSNSALLPHVPQVRISPTYSSIIQI